MRTIKEINDIYNKRRKRAIECLNLAKQIKKNISKYEFTIDIDVQLDWQYPCCQVYIPDNIDKFRYKQIVLDIEQILNCKLIYSLFDDVLFKDRGLFYTARDKECGPKIEVRAPNVMNCEIEVKKVITEKIVSNCFK